MSKALALFFLLALLLPLPAHGGEAETHSFRHQGLERRYLLVAPDAGSVAQDKLPVVFVLHGGGGNAEHAMRSTGFAVKARKEGFMAVFPEGTGRSILKTWNAGHCCGFAMRRGVDDVGFIAAIMDRLYQDPRMDRDRVFVTGMSNGGMMAHRVAIALADRVAAVAPVMSGLFGDEALPKGPVSALLLNGLQDRSIPSQGGHSQGKFPAAWDNTPLKPVSYQGEFWARANGCDLRPEQRREGSVRVWSYPCPPGVAVEQYLLEDSGHAWPGGLQGSRKGDVPSTALKATDVIWDFFQQTPAKRH